MYNYPKIPIKSFQDLDVYQKLLAISVAIAKTIKSEKIITLALDLPVKIATAHSSRFGDQTNAIHDLEAVMLNCKSKTLRQAQGKLRQIFLINKLKIFYLPAPRFYIYKCLGKNLPKNMSNKINKNVSPQKIRLLADSLTDIHAGTSESSLSERIILQKNNTVKSFGVDLRGVEPLQSDLTDPTPHRHRPTQHLVY